MGVCALTHTHKLNSSLHSDAALTRTIIHEFICFWEVKCFFFVVVYVVVVVHSFFLSFCLCDWVLTDQFRQKTYIFLILPLAFGTCIERVVFGVDGFQEPTLDSKILIIAMLFVRFISISKKRKINYMKSSKECRMCFSISPSCWISIYFIFKQQNRVLCIHY